MSRQSRPGRRPGAQADAAGESGVFLFGGALCFGLLMILGLLALVLWNGLATFWPKPIELLRLASGAQVAGELTRSESFRAEAGASASAPLRHLYRVGNYDLYREDFRWVDESSIAERSRPPDLYLFERLEWGVFVGRIEGQQLAGEPVQLAPAALALAHDEARSRWRTIRRIERDRIGAVNQQIEADRLRLRKAELDFGVGSPRQLQVAAEVERRAADLIGEYDRLQGEALALRARDAEDRLIVADIEGRQLELPLSSVVRFYPANDLSLIGRVAVYLSRWWEFVSDDPREANTEGGVFPAIFGTLVMTVLMALLVAPLGVMTALYLREYAGQGRLVSMVRISVNNLAGVPSIVYGVFGLGFFAYFLGGSIDALFYPERLPNPTFGTGGLLWASLTLALLTVPVVIVATEEALAAVPRSMREGALACGASKWQTLLHIVLPRAMPGILTGLILAMARGAGEVAPLMLVGVVKLAPELPIDGVFPYLHLERSFMHLGFHIFDVGFQSRNSEAGKPMVFVTTLLLIALIFLINALAMFLRHRMKQRFAGSRF